MIRTQKKQLFKSSILVITILLVPLVGFFVYGIFYDPTFFVFLAIGLVLSLVYLFPLRNRIVYQKSVIHSQLQNIQEEQNLIEVDIDQKQGVIKAYRQKIANFSLLKGLTEKLSMCLYLEDTSKTLSAEVNRLFGDKETTIILYLFHSKTGELGISSSQKGQMHVNIKSKKGDVFDQWLVKTMHPLLIEDTHSDYRFDSNKIDEHHVRPIRSMMSVPLIVNNKALGILRVDSPNPRCFVTEDLRLLTTIGGLGALAIENAQLYERIERLAIRDGLTNLYLRKYLMDRMPEEFSRHLRRKKELSFVMIDIDKFKQYNNQFGHIAGDIVLKAVSQILSDHFEAPGNLVCRYGGEEFCVLLPHCSKEQAVQSAEELRKKIEKKEISLRREKTHVTVSIGIASFPKDAQIIKELIHRADQALYEAKEKGRNRVIAI